MMHSKFVWAGLALCALALGIGTSAAVDAPETPLPPALKRVAIPPAHPARTMLQSVTRAGSRLVAVGEHGTVILSDNNGATWRAAKRVPVDVTLLRARFATDLTGWAIGHMGVVLRTDDGGETWTKQLDGAAAAQLALATASAAGAAQAEGDKDGAAAVRAARGLVQDGPDKPLLDLLVEDVQRITVVGAFNTAYRSEDGGRHWIAIAQAIDNPKGFHLYGLAATGKVWVAVGEAGLVLRRTGTAGKFTPVALPYDGSMFGILRPTAQGLLVYGLRGRAYRSDDGGSSWTRSSLPGEIAVNDGAVLSGGRIVLGDQGGRVLLSRDGGTSFEAVHKGGIPITGIAEAADGGVVLATLGGIARIPPAALLSGSNGGRQ